MVESSIKDAGNKDEVISTADNVLPVIDITEQKVLVHVNYEKKVS